MTMGAHKFRAQKTICEAGHLHDSKMEAGRCDQLMALEADGAIERLEHQPVFKVEINGVLVCKYVADFAWFTKNCRVIEDVKGVKTPMFNLKKKLVEASHPGTVITLWPVRKRKIAKRKAK